ncbi:hypothetical protein AB0F71_02955 [Kitasatospora sp. NPDC028055]|uniref:hypothetical protein n=1 Tax=Kitasatospora sp. NPDC028055 TaxID=3155653 RepID=UPI0033E41655
MGQWDEDQQHWAEPLPPGEPPPGGAFLRLLIVITVGLLLTAGAGVGLWALSRSQDRQPPVSVPTAPNVLPPVTTSPPDTITPAFPTEVAVTPSTPSPSLLGPRAVVERYYQDLNSRDYLDAWNLGGSNIAQVSYDRWVGGFSTTTEIDAAASDDATVPGMVNVFIRAVQSDGTVKWFGGTYTVTGGVITGAHITQQ